MTRADRPGGPLDGLARPLRRIPLKEEFVDLCRSRGIKDAESPLILAQMEYRYKSSKYLDAYIEEEKARARAVGESVDLAPTHGWIVIDAETFAREVMLNLTPTTMRRRLGPIVGPGWILERNDPRTPWVRTKQYRFDPLAVARDLWALGYVLADWHFPQEVRQLIYGAAENGISKHPAKTQDAIGKLQYRNGDVQVPGCNLQDRKQEIAGSYIDGQILSSESVNQIDRSDPLGVQDQSGTGADTRGPIDRPVNAHDLEDTVKVRAEQLRRRVEKIDDGDVSDAAKAMAVEIVREMGHHRVTIDGAKIAKLAQIYVVDGREHVLRRVVGRVAKTAEVRYPYHHLTYSLAAEPEETNLARRIRTQAVPAGDGHDGRRNGATDGAARRREGYEWLFDEHHATDRKQPS